MKSQVCRVSFETLPTDNPPTILLYQKSRAWVVCRRSFLFEFYFFGLFHGFGRCNLSRVFGTNQKRKWLYLRLHSTHALDFRSFSFWVPSNIYNKVTPKKHNWPFHIEPATNGRRGHRFYQVELVKRVYPNISMGQKWRISRFAFRQQNSRIFIFKGSSRRTLL